MTMLAGSPRSWKYEVKRSHPTTHDKTRYMVVVGNDLIPKPYWTTIWCKTALEANLIATGHAVNNCHAKPIRHCGGCR